MLPEQNDKSQTRSKEFDDMPRESLSEEELTILHTFYNNIDKIGKEAVRKFSKKVLSDMKDFFENLSENRQIMMVALDSLEQNKIEALKGLVRKKSYVPLVHDELTSLFQALHACTGDSLYKINNH